MDGKYKNLLFIFKSGEELMDKYNFKVKNTTNFSWCTISSNSFYYLFLPANLVTGGVTGLSVIFKGGLV